MFSKWKMPRTIQWIINIFFIYLIIFTGFRIATVYFFKPTNLPWSALFGAFWLGLKYDLRWISFILTPIAVLSIYKKFSPFHNVLSKKIWTIYLGIVTLLLLFFYGADFGQFAYINARLNADALIFAEDPKESLEMIWQSYPIIWILAGLFFAVMMMVKMFGKTHVNVSDKNVHIHKFSYNKKWHAFAIIILCWFMYGFFTAQPLNFFRAFNLNDGFKSNLALNPMQNFFTTLRFRKPQYVTKAKENYASISSFLGISTNEKFDYKRSQKFEDTLTYKKPNIVLIICESFSMYKSSMSGNILNSTPYFNAMCKQGIFFDRCFSPTFGTARGVFATITGIPDVQLSKFSTRNEAAITQRTIVNDFVGYEKLYFLGGRSEFNNFKGLMQNIDGLKIYDEPTHKVPKHNVWGISDKNLFLTANEKMATLNKPFFTIIQTADNHRPFNIPLEDKDFIPAALSEEALNINGFESLKEYNAFAYSDYCFKKFIEAAKKEAYFENTIFVFIGDHGLEGNSNATYPKAWDEQRLADEHIPLLFYAPNLITPKVYHKPVSQIDVLPTVAALARQPYTNYTLGRNVLDTTNKSNAAFIIYHAPGWIGVVNDDFFYRKNIHMQTEELVSVTNNPIQMSKSASDSVKKEMSLLTTAIYETSKWMLVNNK